MSQSGGIPKAERCPASARPIWIAGFDLLAVCAFAGVWAALAMRWILQVETATALLAIGLALVPGYAIADAVSGLVHWFADSFFEEDAPVLGRLLIRPFREHHRNAKGITHHGFLEVCGNNSAACFALLFPLWLGTSADAARPLSGAFGMALLLVASFFVFATNGFHRWAHMTEVPPWVGWLQRRRWILSPEEHALHHRGSHDRAYCVTSGWMNPVFDRSGVLQQIQQRASGVTTARKKRAEPMRRSERS